MKLRNLDNIFERPKAVKIFTDRQEPRETFWSGYNEMQRRITHNEELDVKVISFYGIGGIGKTSLLRKLEEELDETAKAPLYVYYDLNEANDCRSVLERLKNLIANKYKFRFPVFEIALYSYALKIGENVKKEDIEAYTDKSPFLSFIMETAQLLPGAELFTQIVTAADKGAAWIRGFVKKRRDYIRKIDKMPPAEILEWLPAFFSADMADNMEEQNKPFVIFLDTYESFVNELGSEGIAAQKDEWLRGKNGPLQNIPKVLWVIAGREKLKWDSDEWGGSLDQHILGSLSETDAESFLTNAGITDKKLIGDIYKLTSGTPVFLDICVDRYFDCIDQGREPTIEEFGRDTSELIKRFAMYMKDGMKDIFYMLSCLVSWNDELIDTMIDSGMIPNLSLTALEKANSFSFITESSDGTYTMHQVVADVLYKECCQNVTRIKERTLDTALDHYLKKLSDHNKYSSDHTALLESTVRLACRLYDNDDELGVFLEDKLGEFFEEMIISYRFDLIDDLLESVNERVKRECATKLGIFILKLKAMICQEKEKTREALSLRYKQLEISRQVLGEGDIKTILTMRDIADTHIMLGQINDALKISKDAIYLCEKHFGESSDRTINAVWDYIDFLEDAKRSREKYKICFGLFDFCRETFGVADDRTFNVAMRLSPMLNTNDSVKLHKYLFEIYKKEFGEDDPKTLKIMNGTEDPYDNAKQLQLQKEILAILKKAPEPDHKAITQKMSSIAERLEWLRRHDEALQMWLDAIKLSSKHLGKTHDQTILIKNRLAKYYIRNKMPDKALQLLRESYEFCKNELGVFSQNTQRARSKLTSALSDLKQYTEIVRISREYLDECKRSLGENSPETVMAMIILANSLFSDGQADEAIKLRREIVKIQTQTLGQTDHDTIMAEKRLAGDLEDAKKYEEALQIYIKLYETEKNVLGQEHFKTEWFKDKADKLREIIENNK